MLNFFLKEMWAPIFGYFKPQLIRKTWTSIFNLGGKVLTTLNFSSQLSFNYTFHNQ